MRNVTDLTTSGGFYVKLTQLLIQTQDVHIKLPSDQCEEVHF